MSNSRVTIVTPSLNQATYLERAICSVLDQDLPHLEYIVVDGGSYDGSLDILRLYHEELALTICEPDGGPAEAINKGLQHATGDIVGFLHADDLYLPAALERVTSAMSDTDWLVGSALRLDERDRVLGVINTTAPRSLADFLMHNVGTFPSSAMFVRRELLDRHGLLDETMQFSFDYEFCCRLLAAGVKPKFMAEPLAVCRVPQRPADASRTVRQGIEHIATARRYAHRVSLTQRPSLWQNCDRREQIYALAEAETYGQEARKFLMARIARHPWWLADANVRRALLFGASRQNVKLSPAALRNAA